MKKIILLVFLVAGAAGAFLYLNRAATPANSEYYADYLPQDTLATISLLDLKGLSESFPLSSMGKFFAKPTIHGILTELGSQPEGLKEYDDIYDGIAGVMTNPAFRQVFGDDAVAALLALDVAQLQSAPKEEMQKSILVFGTSSVTGPLDTFAKLMMSKSVEKQTVDGLEVTRIQLDDEVIYGYTQDGVVILAYAPGNLAQAVALKKNGGGLKNFSYFTAAKNFWAKSDTGREYARSYLNIDGLKKLMAASGNDDAVETAKFLEGFQGMSAVVVEQQDELRLETRVEYDFTALDDIIKDQYSAVSEDNISLDLLTRESLLYYWVSLLDKQYFEQLVKAAGDEQYKLADAQVQQELGLSLDEIIGAVGPQFGLVVNEIINAGLFPLPKVVFYLQIKDHKVAEQIVDRLRKDIASRGFAAEQSEEVNGRTIYYWSVLPGEATQPALVLTDNMLYVANGKSSLAAIISSGSDPGKLPVPMAEALGKDLVNTLEASNYATFVMRPARLAEQVKDAADFLAGMLQANKGVSAGQLKEEMLKLMRSIDIVTATSSIQKDYALSSLVFKQAASEPAKAK